MFGLIVEVSWEAVDTGSEVSIAALRTSSRTSDAGSIELHASRGTDSAVVGAVGVLKAGGTELSAFFNGSDVLALSVVGEHLFA